MFKKEKEPKSINFLDTLYVSSDVWSNAYVWLVNIGKYVLIAVQLVVLAVFFSRFALDRKNNDLTEEINNKVVLLTNDSWKRNAILFDNYQVLLSDVDKIKADQGINSGKISELISGVPGVFTLESISYNEGQASISLKANNLDSVKNYESALKNNPQYDDVKFSITKEEGEISVRVSFELLSEE